MLWLADRSVEGNDVQAAEPLWAKLHSASKLDDLDNLLETSVCMSAAAKIHLSSHQEVKESARSSIGFVLCQQLPESAGKQPKLMFNQFQMKFCKLIHRQK